MLKRLKQPAKPPEPAPQGNPLGEWYADLDFWRGKPHVLMLNAATGIELLLNGNAASLRRLHERAFLQFASLCEHFGLRGPGVDAELHGFDAGFVFGPTRDRSLLGSINERKLGAWMGFEHNGESLVDCAAREWNGLFKHAALGRNARHGMAYHRPLDLLRERLLPSAQVLPFVASPPPGCFDG
ncbi:MAG: hypothetical protein JSR34_08730 [Proteobacteria bacterium]|nr:hypothetical protein [Pseudomonadota bacterium]